MSGKIVNKNICLMLNAFWQPVGYNSVKKAIIKANGGGQYGEPQCKLMDMEFELDEDGNPIFEKPTVMNPVTWEEWCELDVRDYDEYLSTTYKSIRVPTVAIAHNFKKMPMKNVKNVPTKHDIFIRDKGICQLSGKKIPRSRGTVDHVIAKANGGDNSWQNLIYCEKTLNHKKGNKSLEEFGMKLKKLPVKPKPIPVSHSILELNHPTWIAFFPS